MDDRLYADPALARFYDHDNDWGDDLTFCAGLARGARSVLDLGCGTGRFLAVLDVPDRAGVDLAPAMLEIARTRPGGAGADWVAGDARRVRLGRRFELIVLTGHAFQVFLTEADRRAVLETIAAHLAPGGRFVFDSRNPAREEWRTWTPKHSRRRFTHPDLGLIEGTTDVEHDPATGVVTYHTRYEVLATRAEQRALSQIAFPPRREIAALVEVAGLAVTRWMGDWQGAAQTPDAPEIIVIGERRSG